MTLKVGGKEPFGIKIMNNFYIKTDLHADMVEYRYNPKVTHEAYNWKNWVPKVTDIQVVTDLPKEVKMAIRREIYEDILASEQRGKPNE